MLIFAIAFAVKTPVIPFHSWVPDTYTEASTADSMIIVQRDLKRLIAYVTIVDVALIVLGFFGSVPRASPARRWRWSTTG